MTNVACADLWQLPVLLRIRFATFGARRRIYPLALCTSVDYALDMNFTYFVCQTVRPFSNCLTEVWFVLTVILLIRCFLGFLFSLTSIFLYLINQNLTHIFYPNPKQFGTFALTEKRNRLIAQTRLLNDRWSETRIWINFPLLSWRAEEDDRSVSASPFLFSELHLPPSFNCVIFVSS